MPERRPIAVVETETAWRYRIGDPFTLNGRPATVGGVNAPLLYLYLEPEAEKEMNER